MYRKNVTSEAKLAPKTPWWHVCRHVNYYVKVAKKKKHVELLQKYPFDYPYSRDGGDW